jgi:hypothetical protein
VYYFCQMESNSRNIRRVGNQFVGITYNVTTKVDWLVHDAWLKWMIEVHIPNVISTGCFDKHTLVRILETDESEGATYAVQYHTDVIERYHEYIGSHSSALRKEVMDKWGARIISFHTLMGTVQ